MINNYGDTGSGFGGHGQPSAPLPRTMEHSKQQNVAPGWGYNTQLEGLYTCYPSEPQPMYNIHSMGHFDSSGKHNNNHYPQYPAGAMHQPVPTPIVKCHEACCQNLSDHSRYPVNPAPLRYPPAVSVQPPRYGDISNSEHRQYFQDRRSLQSSVARKKEFQTDAGFNGVHHDRHFSQCVGRGQIHVPESRQSMQVVRSQYPVYPINSYWSPRSWSGPRVNYPPPPPYHQSVSSQSAQLQSGIKMPDPPHYIQPNMQKQLGNQQRRAAIRNGNGTTEVVRPVPENKRPAIDGNHIQSCYDFPYTSGFIPFNDVSKMTSNSISQITNTSCKISNDKQFQHQMQYAVQSNDRTVSGCNDPMGDISYSMNFPIPNGESYMRPPVEGSEQISATRKLAMQYEQPSVGKKRPDLDVRQFLATWEDDEEENPRMSEPLTNSNNGAPYIVVDYRSLDNESSAKTQERLKPSGVQVCSSKPQNSSPGLDNKRQTSGDVNSREKENQRSVIHTEYLSQNSFLQPTAPTAHNDMEKNINFWGPNSRENCPVSEAVMTKGVFQPLDCSKRDTLNIVEPIMPPKRDSHIHGDMSNHKMMSNDSNHISFDALVTYYGDSRRGSDGSYDLVEMTERLVNAADKICTSERNPLDQQLPPDIMGCNEMRVHHQPQIGVNPNSFHNRMPPHYASNTFQHFKQSVSTDGFFNLKQPVAHSKYFGIDQTQMLEPGNFEFHKVPTEFENQRTYSTKDSSSTTKIQEGIISKDGSKACLQGNKKAMCNESLRNSEVESSDHSHSKESLEFDGVDPEQFITPIVIKKSDYRSKECDKIKDTTKDKNSQTETEVISEQTLYNTGVERTVLISPNDIGAEVFKVSYSPDKKQFSEKDNVVTLHSGDNTKCNTVTVEVPYVQQYSNLVKLSEEMTQADNIPESKSYTSSEVQCNTTNNTSGPSADVKNTSDDSKRTTSLKLKRLPNSKEWIKIDEKIKAAQNNDCVNEKSENHNKKDSTSDSIENSPARVSNLNMPSLDDIQDSSHIETASETQRVVPTESRVTSNYSSRSRHNDGINSENMSIPQLAIVSPLKFASDGKDENSTSVQSNIKQKKDNYFQTDKQFFTNNTNAQNYEDSTPNNNCLQREIENQFQQVHSPYNTLYLSQKQNLVQSGHSSSAKHFSDAQYLSENGNEKHENFKSQKKIQRVESFQQTISTDMSENNQQILKSKDSHKEQFSSFYSGRDITSHISPFNLSNRLITNEKDLDHHIPTSPGVDEMFEDINNPGHESLFQNKTDNLPDLTENSSFTLTSSCQTGNSFDSFFEQGSSVDGNRPCVNVKRSEGITLNQNKTPDDGNRSNCCIIMKNSNVKSLSCETLPSENEEALPLTLSVKVNSKSTWNLSQKRENCEENNICNERGPVEGSTDFGTLSSSEPVSSSRKDFINESLRSFEYVHTSVLQEMSLNNSVTESSSELVVDTDKCQGKFTTLTKETDPKKESKYKCSLINSDSDVDSALKVADKQKHVNCNSEKISENSDFEVEYEVNASNETDNGVKSITKLESLDNVFSTKSDENIEGNQPGEQWKPSHICSSNNNSESGKKETEIIQTAVSSVETTAVDSENITLGENFNTNEDKCEGTESSMGETNYLKQACIELAQKKKSNNESKQLHEVLCSENKLNILPETIQDKVAEENVNCKVDSDNCPNSVTDNQTNLTGNVHSDCNEKSQTVAESTGNCISVKNNIHSLHSTNETVENGDQGDQEILELTVNKFVEPHRGIVNETDDDENVIEADSELVKCENIISANENITEDNTNVSECRESNEAKPVSDIQYEERCNVRENMPYHIEQEAVINEIDIEKSQTTCDNASEVTMKDITSECGDVVGCESVRPTNETESNDERSMYCVLVNDSKAENDNIDSTLNGKDIKEIEENHDFDSEKQNNNKAERESLNTVTDETELVASECAEKVQSDQIEECSVQEMYDELAKQRKFENEIVVIKTRTEYKNSIKCNSLIGSKIAVVSPLQSAEKHSDNVGLDIDNTGRSQENRDCFQDHCSTMMRTNKLNCVDQEEDKHNNEVVNTSSNLTVECTDHSESDINRRQVKIISNYSNTSDSYTSVLSEPLDTSISDKCNRLDVQGEYTHNKISPLQRCKTLSECEHKNYKAFNFSCEETVVDLSSGTRNERKEIMEALKDTKYQNSTENNSGCNLDPHFCGALEDSEKKDKDQNIAHEKSVNEEQYSACKIVDHLDSVENKMQVESNFDSVSNLQDKICSDNISQSCIEYNQSVLDVETKTSGEFTSTDLTHDESGKENELDTNISDTELRIENKSVSSVREVVTENEDQNNEHREIADARTEDYGETNVISCIKNTIKENNKENETCNVCSNTINNLHSSEASLQNETSCSYLCTSEYDTCEYSNKHMYTTSDINDDVKKGVDETGEESSTADNSQCVTENPILKELSMNKIDTKEQHIEHVVSTSETTDCILQLENTAVQPQNSHLILNKLLTQNNKPDSEKDCNVEYNCTLNKEDVFENKNETNMDYQLVVSDDYKKTELKIFETIQDPNLPVDETQPELRELPVESKEKNKSVTSLENVTVSSGSNNAVSNTIYKNVCKHTSVSLHGDILTNTENGLCDPSQYGSVCHNSDVVNSNKRHLPFFEGAYHNECISGSRGSEQEDLRNLNHNDNNEYCMPSGDSGIRTDSELLLRNVELTSNVAGIQNDNQVMDLSCNFAKESWLDGTNFEKVHHEGSKKTDSDDFNAREVSAEKIVDCASTSSSDQHENISETVGFQYGKCSPDGVISRDDGLSPSLETKYKTLVNTDRSVFNSSSNTDVLDCSKNVSAETECEVECFKTDGSCEDEVADSQFVDNVKGCHVIDGLQNKTITPCGFGFNGELKNQINQKCTNKYLPINFAPCSLNGHDNPDWKYVSCGLKTCMSGNALVEEHSIEEGNANGGSEIFCKSPSEHQSSINTENLPHPEKHTEFSDNNSNVVNLENTSVGETNKLQLPDTSFTVGHCDSVQENGQKNSGVVNTYSADNCVFETTKIDSVSTHNENSLCYKPVQSDYYTIKKSCEVVENESVLDENTFTSRSKDDVETPQNLLEPPNVENSLESLSGNSQKENFSKSDKNHVSLQIPKKCMTSDVKSKVGTFNFNQSELENNVLSDSSEDMVNEDKIELNINENEANTNTENESAVVSDQKLNGSGISSDMCLSTFEPENLYINQINSLDFNQDSPISNEKRCVEDSLLENIDRVRNSLTLNGNNNFEKLVDPYEFQSSVYTGEQKDILTSKNVSVFQHVSTSNDISIKSEILSNITNIPSKESCPLQCLVEAALALETAVVNKISQENTDSIQNSSHVVKCKNFYCDNLLNEDCKNVINSSTIGTVQSLDSSFGTDYEVIHSALNSQLHQTRNEEVRCSNESSLDDMNVSSSEYFVPNYQRNKGIKQKERRKIKKKYKKNCISRLKCSMSVVDSRSKSDTVNSNDSVTKEKEEFIEHTYDNAKDSDIDIRFPCDSYNLCCKTSLSDILDERREEFLASSVPSEDNRISQETICMQDETGDNGCTQRDFIIPDQSVVCFQVTSDKMDEYMNQISNLSDIEVITESTGNNNLSITKSVGNKSCLDGYPKIPDVELENETSLVIIIEEIGSTCERLPDKGNVSLEENFEHVDDGNIKQSVEDKDCSPCADYFLLTTKEENNSSCTSLQNESAGNDQLAVIYRDVRGEENLKSKNVKNIFDNSGEQKLHHCCETSESYEHINENLVNDISNWPFLEEEIALEQNGSSKKSEPKKQPYHLKCSLPWERIFNISNSRKRKTSRSKQDTNVGLELGPAKVEVRIGSESGVWKVVNNSYDYSSPVVKVKRLILQRDPDLTSSYSEKESEEENDIREKRKKSLSQSSDDSVPKVIIKKKSTSEYTSFLRLSDDEKWQPVVMLTRNKELDELIRREKHTVSSPCYNNYLEAIESNNLERQQSDIFDFAYDNDSTEETKLKGTTGNKMISEISNCAFKNAIKKRPFKRRFKFGKSKEKKFNKSNLCINGFSVEKRVFSDDEESSGSNKESDYSPTCPVDASQEFAWQCIEKNGGESPETDSLSKDCGINCLMSQEETTVENEDNMNIVDVASDNKEFSNPTGRSSPEVSEDTELLMNCAASIETKNCNFLCINDNTLAKDDCVSIKSCDTDINQLLKSSAEDINEEVKLFNLTVTDELNSADIAPKECEFNVHETVSKSSSDDSLNQNQCGLENLASKNEIDPRQSSSTDIASDIQIFGSINDSYVQSSQHSNSLLSNSFRDLIIEKPPSENRDRGLKRPSEGHSREDTKRRRYSIKRYPLECHKCHIGFEDKEELMRHKKSRHTPRELHHCLLCQRSFSSSLRYSLHLQGRSHRHIDLVQRYTMHTMHRLITGTDYPHLRPLTKSELQALDWRPSHPGCNHYYHQPTPLQIALQEHSKGDNKIAVNHT